MTDSYDQPLARLHEGEITYQQFLSDVNCEQQFTKWCREHHLKADEGAAQLFFDYYGFEDSSLVKEFVEPIL